jgi:hypothetical protein
MHTRITLNHNLFRRLVQELDRDPAAVLTCAAGIGRLRDSTTLLVYALERDSPGSATSHRLLVCGGVDPASIAVSIRTALARIGESRPTAILSLGVGGQSGDVSGVFRVGDSYTPLDEVSVLEPGLPRTRLVLPESVSSERDVNESRELEIWSRSIGALGEAAWKRLTDLHFSVVGCGRSGMEVATSLGRLGVSQITVIDGDCLEATNLGELFPGVNLEHLGQPKTNVLAALLSEQRPNRLRRLTAVPESISSQPALVAAKDTDFLISCVDTPVARAATAFLAKLYLRPVLDVGTGIHWSATDTASHEVGADIRLVLPDRCLLCFGGIRRIDIVRQEQRDFREGRGRNRRNPDWRTERPGSLRSLNITGVGLGIRLVEELVQAAWQRVVTARLCH